MYAYSSKVGGFYCECPTGFQGQICSFSRNDLFQNVQLFYNYVHFANTQQNFVIFVSDLGQAKCTVELMNVPNAYSIESFHIPEDEWTTFHSTDNIQAVIRSAGIKNWNSADPIGGYYTLSSMKIEKIGKSELELSVTDTEKDTIYFNWNYEVMVNVHPDECHPQIEISNW